MGDKYGDLSLAQVEEELRSAEAYLTACGAPPPAPTSCLDPIDGREWAQRNDSGQERDESNFRRKLKTRPVLSEERRREILAKLSSERQAVLKSHVAGESSESLTVEGAIGDESEEINYYPSTLEERKYRTPEERHQLIQKLLADRSVLKASAAYQGQELFVDAPHAGDVDAGENVQVGFRDESDAYSDVRSAESDDDGEIYYASDILDNVTATDIQPRSGLDFIYEAEEFQQVADDPNDSFRPEPQLQQTTTVLPSGMEATDQTMPPSVFAELLKDEARGENTAHDEFESINETQTIVEESWKSQDEPRGTTLSHLLKPTNTEHYQQSSIRPPTRLDVLAQPRNQTFAEREKQRLLSEMEQLRECTFHPNVLKPPRSTSKSKALGQGSSTGRPGTTEFQWLTLSPRQKIFRRGEKVDLKDGYNENDNENVTQRLHLNGKSRYDSRERAREALETQELQKCTFKPKINAISKSMFSMVDYKPIQDRVSDLQRAKAEYIERIREQLELEEYGPLSFTPTINPKSQEIATNKIAEKEAGISSEVNGGKLKYLKVTERLAEDADAVAERRLATQEYFDMLNEQPYAPKISETSRKIVEQKPEFKMDFVARQEYFQSRDQEKMEALEGFCDMDFARGERLTFKPDIGNADGVLLQLRPDRRAESSQQKLYRLSYSDQREAEMKKHRLREEQFAQYTFKPEINPVSRVLGRSSTLDELSHPVLDIQPEPQVSKRSPPQEKGSGGDAPESRVALRQYFANKRFRSRVALEMEEANKAECTFQPSLSAPKTRNGSSSATKLYNREPRCRTKLEWQSENLLHLIEAERQKKADEIETKRNALELKELEECTFRPNLRKPKRRGQSVAKGSPSPARDDEADEKPVIVRGLGRFLELRDLARKQQAEQKQREQKVFARNTAYEPRSYTIPKPFKLSESSKDTIRRQQKVREEMRAKERQECTFRPQTVSAQNRRVLQNMLNN